MESLALAPRVEGPRGCQVLDDVAEGFVDGDLVGRAAAFDLARQHLTDFRDNVVITDQASLLGSEELRTLVENALATVDDEAGADDEVVLFPVPGFARISPQDSNWATSREPATWQSLPTVLAWYSF